jgi:hypothetical protein
MSKILPTRKNILVRDIIVIYKEILEMEKSREIEDRDIYTSIHKDQKFVERLQRAWYSIQTEHLEKVKELILTEGPGVCIFQLFRPDERKNYNCEVFYLPKSNDLWKLFLNDSARTHFKEKYDENSMICVCISMPLYEIGDERIENLKLFDTISLKEIFLD